MSNNQESQNENQQNEEEQTNQQNQQFENENEQEQDNESELNYQQQNQQQYQKQQQQYQEKQQQQHQQNQQQQRNYQPKTKQKTVWTSLTLGYLPQECVFGTGYSIARLDRRRFVVCNEVVRDRVAKVVLWDVMTRRVVRQFKEFPYRSEDIAFISVAVQYPYVAAASFQSVYVWNVEQPETTPGKKFDMIGPETNDRMGIFVQALALQKYEDQKTKSIKVLTTWVLTKAIEGVQLPVNVVKKIVGYIEEFHYVVSASSGGCLSCWDVVTGENIIQKKHNGGYFSLLKPLPFNQPFIAVADEEHNQGFVEIYDLIKCEPVKILAGHESPLIALATIANENLVTTSGQTSRIWTIDQQKQQQWQQEEVNNNMGTVIDTINPLFGRLFGYPKESKFLHLTQYRVWLFAEVYPNRWKRISAIKAKNIPFTHVFITDEQKVITIDAVKNIRQWSSRVKTVPVQSNYYHRNRNYGRRNYNYRGRRNYYRGGYNRRGGNYYRYRKQNRGGWNSGYNQGNQNRRRNPHFTNNNRSYIPNPNSPTMHQNINQNMDNNFN